MATGGTIIGVIIWHGKEYVFKNCYIEIIIKGDAVRNKPLLLYFVCQNQLLISLPLITHLPPE